MRGQTAVEYLIIFSTMLAILAGVTIAQMINHVKDAGGDTLHLSQARSAADAIGGAIDTVYANGEGAVKTVTVRMDTTWGLQLDNSENVIRITLETSSGTQNVEDNLKYGIDNHHSLSSIPSGVYTVIVEWPDEDGDTEQLDGSSISENKIYIYIIGGAA